MDGRIHDLLHRNLQEVFGEGDATRRRAAIQELYAEDCEIYTPPGKFVGHAALDNSPEIFARHIRILFTRRWANPRLSTMPVAWLGALVRAARRPTIRVWM
jgi:hypothetical protein